MILLAKLEMRWCTKCESLCTLYEQGLSCNCGPAWKTERVHEEDYPACWVEVFVEVYLGSKEGDFPKAS